MDCPSAGDVSLHARIVARRSGDAIFRAPALAAGLARACVRRYGGRRAAGRDDAGGPVRSARRGLVRRHVSWRDAAAGGGLASHRRRPRHADRRADRLGKTLAAFLWAIDELVREARAGTLADATSVVYVSPLKALGNDIEKNLAGPLAAIRERADAAGVDLQGIRVAVRSGDTPQAERQAMLKHPPHVLITTPESLYILLTAEKSRPDAAVGADGDRGRDPRRRGDKRGAHLALTLARLDLLAGRRLQRIGLSATQKPIEEIASLLVGTDRVADDGTPDCAIVDTGHKRAMELSIETTDLELGASRRTSCGRRSTTAWSSWSDSTAPRSSSSIPDAWRARRARPASGSARARGRAPRQPVAAHPAARRRRSAQVGRGPGVVATASLELGIDVGHVDLVCQLGAPRASRRSCSASDARATGSAACRRVFFRSRATS